MRARLRSRGLAGREADAKSEAAPESPEAGQLKAELPAAQV